MTGKIKFQIVFFCLGAILLGGCSKDEDDDNVGSGTCSDGIQNQNETDVDCGGICSPCSMVQPNTLNVSSQSFSFGSSSGSRSVSITSNVDWSVSTSSFWISASPSSGSDNGSISVSVSSNSSTSSRSGVVTVSGGGLTRNISISQSGEDDPEPTQYGTISFYRAVGNGPFEFYFEGDYLGTIYSTYYTSNPGCFPSGAMYNTDLLPYGNYSYNAYILNGLGEIVYNYSGSVYLDNPCETVGVGP
ncbi:BACON domain-containing protein [Cryomorphaceae bacterium 1068]|nr:BACON domain-containing protein [Cryomorphaceae bacterium 1068]